MESHNKKSFKVKLNPHITIYPVETVTVNHKNYPKDLVTDYYKVVAELTELKKRYSVKEKMYTREEVLEIVKNSPKGDATDNCIEQWFEQNVK